MRVRMTTLVLAVMTACSSTNGGGGTGGSGGAGGGGGGAEQVDAGPVGTGESSTQRIGPSGGSVTVGCVTLTVPAGALSADVDVKLTSTTERPPAGYETYSPVVRIEPAMTALAAPASLSLCFNGNAQLATVFLSREGTTGYERRGGVVMGNSITAPISRFGDAFVANGVEYVDPANRNCANLTLLEGRSGGLGTVSLPDGGTANLSSSVALMFRAEDCYGRPLTGLTSDDFVVKEDDAPLSVEANKTILPTPGLQVFASLVLDMSSSTQPNVMQLITAAKAFVTRVQGGSLRVPISIQLFAGEPTLREWQAPTLDTAKLLQKLDDVATYTPMDPASTNLYGAVIDALSRSATAQNAFRQRNAGGAFSTGYVILFTDGQDTTGLKTRMEALTAAKASPDTLVAVALNTPDFTAAAQGALNELTSGDASDGKNVLVSDNAARLATDFDAVAYRIAGLSTGAYLLGYCSPKRAGQHSVAVELANATTRQRAEWSFSATGFSPGCSSDAFGAVCQDASGRKECGGLACGSCDDRVAKCNTSTLRCDSYCLGPPAACGGTMITNPLGYEQTCADRQEATSCGGSCADLNSDALNCGACGNSCTMQGYAFCINQTCDGVNHLAVGPNDSCTGFHGGSVRCWGDNNRGQLGDGTTTTRTTPVAISTLTNAVEIALGLHHNCARLRDGSLRCWGSNYSGELGDGSTVDRYAPVPVLGLSNAVELGLGAAHNCARLQDNSLRCWGDNSFGQLGDGTTVNRSTPVPVSGVGNAIEVVIKKHCSCARLQDGTVRCWGDNFRGQLGDGTTTNRSSPVLVQGLSNVVELAMGEQHSCARLQDGSVRCWGANDHGELGDGTTISRATPVPVSGLGNVVELAVETGFSCARLQDGSIRCWGNNAYHQLGDGTATTRTTPVPVAGVSNAVELAVGYSSCARLQDGSVRCWGSNSVGQLGDGTTADRSTAVAVSGLSNAVEVALGDGYSCARLQDGSVRCWGGNTSGQLGNGSTTNSSVPTPVRF